MTKIDIGLNMDDVIALIEQNEQLPIGSDGTFTTAELQTRQQISPALARRRIKWLIDAGLVIRVNTVRKSPLIDYPYKVNGYKIVEKEEVKNE